jgi:hypothetical protein
MEPNQQQVEEQMEEQVEEPWEPALLETLHKADSKLTTSFRQAAEPESIVQSFFGRVADSFTNASDDVTSFFK